MTSETAPRLHHGEPLLPPVRVARGGTADARATRLRLPRSLFDAGDGVDGAAHVAWSLEVHQESGIVLRRAGREAAFFAGDAADLVLAHPQRIETGAHRLVLRLDAGAARIDAEQTFVLVPATCADPFDVAAAPSGRARPAKFAGITCNLYSIRSAQNLGIGDFGDLRRLVLFAARHGLDFVGVNPLHAIRNTRDECSPYAPVSRLFRNPLYIDVRAVPEVRRDAAARKLLAATAREPDVAGREIDWPAVAQRKDALLRLLHRRFAHEQRDRDTARGRDYRHFLGEQGRDLADFATFTILDRHFRARPEPIWHWRHWPEELRDPASPAVARFREENFEEFDYQRWLQFEADRQLGAVAELAKRRGLRLGLYQDLAIGAVDNGADHWMHAGTFAEGVELGAPPDLFSATGQVWGFPPHDPEAMKRGGYAFFRSLVRANMRHTGVLRMDHAIGLVRQFWVPRGGKGVDGRFVPFPADDLLGIIALESRRNGTVVVGEDLGVVPPELPPLLSKWGVLCTRVLVFERTADGGFVPAAKYPALALASANTHDHVPLPGFLDEEDLPILRRVGLLPDDKALQEARAERRRHVELLLKALRAEGALPKRARDGRPPSRDVVAAVYAFLAGTAARLAGISLDDVAGETTPVNVPTATPDRYPVWSRRMSRSLEEIVRDPFVARLLRRTVRIRRRVTRR